jgi:DNA-binding transcriptional MerR regulator
MKQQLSQMAFDFFAPVEEPVVATPAPAKKETAAPLPPAVIYANEEAILENEATPLVVEEPALVTTVLSSKKLNTTKTDVADRKPGKRGRRSLKDNLAAAAFVNIPPDEELYKKQYYSIGDVAAMFGEKQSLIRFWEIEFDILQPRKNRKGDRFFRPIDIKNLEMIYDLLRRRKFTIEGAKDYLKKNKQAEGNYAAIQSLEKIKGFLLELKASL